MADEADYTKMWRGVYTPAGSTGGVYLCNGEYDCDGPGRHRPERHDRPHTGSAGRPRNREGGWDDDSPRRSGGGPYGGRRRPPPGRDPQYADSAEYTAPPCPRRAAPARREGFDGGAPQPEGSGGYTIHVTPSAAIAVLALVALVLLAVWVVTTDQAEKRAYRRLIATLVQMCGPRAAPAGPLAGGL